MKKNRNKRIMSLLLTLCMVLTMMMTGLVVLPTEVHAATNVAYLDAAGNAQTAPTVTEVTDATDILTTGWYVVNTDVTRENTTGTVATITVEGDVHLILANNTTLKIKGSDEDAGINVTGNNSLTIYAQSTVESEMGKIIAISGYRRVSTTSGILYNTGGAGIGGARNEDAGKITINGGNIEAESYSSGAGIGGGYNGRGGIITINGGIVYAHNVTYDLTAYGAGIGSGWNTGYGLYPVQGVNNGEITINGGTVTAAGHLGAGIGGGFASNSGKITINGGTIDAKSYGDIGYGHGSGAGIGGGCSQKMQGEYTSIWTGDADNITITGGNITAKGYVRGAGIGGGGWYNSQEAINKGGSGGTITISGGTVNAIGALVSAGIGGGKSGDGGVVNISGGTVFAENEYKIPYDIGGGYDSSSNGSLTVSGTAALFLRNDKSTPVTTFSHGHKTFVDSTVVTDYTVPTTWNSEFGAWLPAATYAVTVNSGTGGGSFAEGATVNIIASAPATGKLFDKWTTTDGVTFANANNATTTFTMPANAVTVIATYKDIPPETPDYKIIDGENGTWNKGKTTGMVITSNGNYDDFTGVSVDDNLIDASNYTVAAGSTIVTLKPAYLETLTEGTHLITLKFGNYSVQTNLTILAANEEADESNTGATKDDTRIPQTGVNYHTLIFSGLMILSGSAIIVITYNKKKKRSYNK